MLYELCRNKINELKDGKDVCEFEFTSTNISTGCILLGWTFAVDFSSVTFC